MKSRQFHVFVATLLVLGVAVSAAAQVEDYRDIEYPQLGEFVIPKPEIFELSNGLKVFMLEDHELPLIEVTARIRTGSIYEPAEKTGLAAIAGQVQRTGGTARMTGDEIDDFLEARAASVETNISTSVGFASMDCLTDDFDQVFSVFLDVLRTPQFAEDKIELAKVQAKTGIARRNDDVNGITSREFNRLVYGYDSPMARMTEYATIAAITRDDLLAWHGKYYHPNNIYLGIVGDFDSKAMKKKIEAAFADWQRGPDFAEPKLSFADDSAAGVYFIEKTDVTQANISLGHLGITVDNPDYFAVEVMNEILGGGFSSRLFSRIRSEKGLAYSVFGGVRSSFAYPGVARFGMQTKSETMGEAVDALKAEVEGMISEPATAEELERAKESILNSFIFNYATKEQVLSQQMLYAYYGLPLDFLEKYRSNIEKVTGEDVQRVAEKYIHPDKAKLLVVGKAGDFDRPMSSFGSVEEIDITIPEPEAPKLEVADTEEARAAGREVFARMAKALGGENPASTAAVRTSASMSLNVQGQSMTLAQETLVVYPDRVHTKLQTPAGEQVVVIDGDEGFMMMAGQTRPMPAEAASRQLGELGRDVRTLVRLPADSEELSILAAGSDEVDGTACDLIAVEIGEVATNLCVDADGRVLKQMHQGTHPVTQAPGQFEIFFADYRDVEGRLVPFKRTIMIDGGEFAETTADSVEFDPEYDAAIFEKPAA